MSAVKKVLFTSHTANFHKFNRPFMRMLKEQGYEVHYASAGEEKVYDTDKHFDIPFERSPFKFGNIKAYFKLKKIIDREKYDLIHTHTPMGSVVTRLAAREARKRGTRVIYTAHGFHFFKGAPLLNWIIYYPIEKYMARHTDTLITINNEDFERAKKKFKTDVEYVPGVGVDLKRFRRVSANKKTLLRREYGYKEGDIIMVYAAELNENKNQEFLIRQAATIVKNRPDVKLLLCGIGPKHKEYEKLIKNLGLSDNVQLLGYRNDIESIFQLSDICVASSIREGLGLNILEAMATGLPVLATNNRGHRDVVRHPRDGLLYDVDQTDRFLSLLDDLILSLRPDHLAYHDDIAHIDRFSTTAISKKMKNIYQYTINHVLQGYGTKSINERESIDISVVIPAYNAADTIERALLSVLNQSRVDFIKQVIVIDDGSIDNTARIVKSISRSHAHGSVVMCKSVSNGGVSKARNTGISLADSNWVALLDADDYWAESKIEKQVVAIEAEPNIRFIGTNSQMGKITYGKKVGDSLRKISFLQYMFKSSPSTCSIIFDKDLIDEVGIFDENQKYAEDANLFMRMIHRSGGYYLTDRLLFLDEKPTFGARGLSGNLKGMHEGCLKNISDARAMGYVSYPLSLCLILWEQVKFTRRVVLTGYRSIRAQSE